MLSEHLRSRAAWGRPSWTVNLLVCGTTERDRETAKDVLSGKQTLISCILFVSSLFFTLQFIPMIFKHTDRQKTKREVKCFVVVVVFSPQRSDGEGTVQLDGEGYAAVGRPTRWNPNVSTVTFKFRTFSSDALLMYLATEDMVRIKLSEKNS